MTNERTLQGDKQNRELRRSLRTSMTPAERRLWQQLRGKAFAGLNFRRLHGIGPYIVDFFCPAQRLVIEIDGDTHGTEEVVRKDKQRERYLTGLGVRTVRYQNKEIMDNIAGVLQNLLGKISP